MRKCILLFFIVFIVIFLNNISFSDNAFKKCSFKDAKKAEELAGTAKSWVDLYGLYKNYNQCDDGAVAEGFSESVTILLSRSWGQINELNKMVEKDDKFEHFVLKHIDETAPEERIKEIADLAINQCTCDIKILCDKIRKRINELDF